MSGPKPGARARFVTLAIAVSLAGTAIAAGQPQIVGINAAVLNNVRIRSAGAPQAHIAVVRQRVALNDEVQTGGRSQLQVLLLDKSVFNVGANARLTIDRFVYDPNRGARSLAASVTKGAFRFISGRPDAPGSTSIRTPIASIGVRGTIVDGVVGQDAASIAAGEAGVGPRVRGDPATASLIILRGPGRRTQGRVQPGVIDVTSGNRTVTIDRPMRAVYVPAAGMAPIAFTISAAGLEQVQALIFPALAQALGLRDGQSSGTGFTPPDRSLPGYRGRYPGPGYPGPGGYPDQSGPPGAWGPQYPIPTGQGFPPQDPGGSPISPNSSNGAPVQKKNNNQVNNAGPAPTPTPSPPNKYPGKP